VTAVHVVVPDGIDDPARPSGGNVYDRWVCRELSSRGWSVYEHAVPGSWPRPDAPSLAALARVIERIPDHAVVLLDGLVASTAPAVLVPQAPPDDPAALAAALRAWLGDAEVRRRLRRAASERRGSLQGWSSTTSVIARVLARESR
jgi:hypothetical protein